MSKVSSLPVLIVAFNRPEKLALLIESLRECTTGKLYFAVDGARNPAEALLVNKTLSVIKNLSWPWGVDCRIASENYGCRAWVSSSISWFFQSEEFGVVLEEDVVVDKRFFEWCQGLRHARAQNPKIMHINAFSADDKFSDASAPRLSRYCTSWGWATWRDAWENYDDEMKGLFEMNEFDRLIFLKDRIGCGWRVALYYYFALKMAKQDKVSSWAYRWNYTVWKMNGFSVSPGINLSRNLGVEKGASHTSKEVHLSDFVFADATADLSFDIGEWRQDKDFFTFGAIMRSNSLYRLIRMFVSSLVPNRLFFYIRSLFR